MPALVSDLLHPDPDLERAVWYVAGLAAGVVWQLLYRRDLTSRLTLAAVCTGLAMTSALVSRTDIVWDDMNTEGLYAFGTLLGLIFAEQYLRRRDRSPRSQPGSLDV